MQIITFANSKELHMSTTFQPSLLACLLMDFIGSASYFFPAIGEAFDIVWAPISGYIFYRWFHTTMGAIGATIEEILPFTDIVPSFTIGYFIFIFPNRNKQAQQR